MKIYGPQRSSCLAFWWLELKPNGNSFSVLNASLCKQSKMTYFYTVASIRITFAGVAGSPWAAGTQVAAHPCQEVDHQEACQA